MEPRAGVHFDQKPAGVVAEVLGSSVQSLRAVTCNTCHKLTLFLQSSGLVEVRELWFIGHFIGHRERCILVLLIVELEVVVGVHEILASYNFELVKCPLFSQTQQSHTLHFSI